jgi:PPP family 3-phenylpropionic acid transporter
MRMVKACMLLSAVFLIVLSLLTNVSVQSKISRNSHTNPSKQGSGPSKKHSKHSNLNVKSALIAVLTKNENEIKKKTNVKGGEKVTENEKEGDLKGFRLIRNKISQIRSLRLPFQREKIAPVVIPAIEVQPPSSLGKINILMLLFYSTLGAAMPFIPLYYRHIGIPNDKVGLLGAITPAITFIVSPLWGALADSTGRHKEIMLLTFIGSVVARSGLGLINGKSSIVYIFLIVAVSAILNAPVKPLMDSAVMSMLVDKSDYGRSRVFGQVGFGLGSYLVGPFISKNIEYIFYLQLLFAIPTAALMAGFQPVKSEKKKEKVDVLAAINHMMSDPTVLVFFLMVFLIGVSSGVVENFAYMRMAEVGGSSGNVLGVCRLLSSLAGGPMFWLSGAISKRIGVNGVLTVSLVSYVLRFFIYASIQNPWQAIPAEILRGTTFAIFWAGSTYFVYNASPKGLTATMVRNSYLPVALFALMEYMYHNKEKFT